jgi:putative addiction module killer protein
MTPEIVEYLDANETSQFARWFDELDPQAAAKVTVALQRIRQGNLSNVKGVGAGILEYRIDFGPGYRIYFGRDGERIVVLLGGGTKRRQERDIETAQARWVDYRRRKKGS